MQTKENVPLAIHLAALPCGNDEPFGDSHFADVLDFVWEIASRNRQVRKILDDHAEPPMVVPDGALDENSSLNVRKMKVFTRGINGEGVEYPTWDARLKEAYDEIDRLVDATLLMTETPPALFGREEGGIAESGRALKFRLLAALGKSRRNGAALSSALAESARLALRREDILQGRSPGDYEVAVQLPDKFIADEIETAQEVQTLRAAQAMSIEAAVEQGQGLVGVDLTAEVERIRAEQPSGAPVGFESGRVL